MVSTQFAASRPRTQNPRFWRSIFLIAAIAFACRVIAIYFLYGATWNDLSNHLLFGFEVGRIARALAEGHGFANPLYVQTGPTAWTTPVYAYLLALVFKLFGVYSKGSALVILTFNAIFSALTSIPICAIALRIFDRRTAFVACCMWAFFPAAISSSVFVWDTCLSALLMSALFHWTYALRENVTAKRKWFTFGAACGFAVLTNASILSLVPFLTLWALSPVWRRRRIWLASAALVLLGVFIVLLPWQVRNYRTFHQVIPLRSTFWLEVWVGNDGYSQMEADMNAHPSMNSSEADQYIRMGEMAYMESKREQALIVLVHHKRYFVAQCWRRFIYTWTNFWNLDPVNLEKPVQICLTTVITVLMLLGLWQALRRNRTLALPFCIVAAVYPLVFYVTHPATRYRHVIDPEIVILAAVGVMYLFSRIKAVAAPSRKPLKTAS